MVGFVGRDQGAELRLSNQRADHIGGEVPAGRTATSSQSITLRWEEMLQGDGAADLVIYSNRVANGGHLVICEIGVSNDRRLLDLRSDRRHRTADPD
jgi:hypothetical protein